MSRVLRITDANTRKINNAVFDNWTSGAPNSWTSTGSPTTVQTVSEGTIQTFASAYALDIRNASTAAVRGWYQDITDVNSGQTYYVSVYVKPVTGNVRLYAWDGGGTSNAVFVESSGTEWQQLIVEKTATSGGIRIGLIAFDAGSQAVFDLVQLATFNIEFIEGVYSTFFRVTNWEIQVPDYKGSGVFSSSPVAEGRKLIDGYWDNVVQTITFHLRGDGDTDITTQNAAAEKLSELFDALQAARDFSKTSWVRDPVYMQYKADNETNYRYAFIANARIPQLADQYNIEFAQLVMLDLDLIIEHPVAFGMPPGEGAPVLSGTRMTYNSQNYGNYDDSGAAEDTAEWVQLANRYNLCNITNMHIGTGGSNLIGGSLPRNIASSSTSTYFGINTSLSDSGVFGSIVFHISRAAVGTTGTWQYWNSTGGTWSNLLTTTDTTSDFTNLGWQTVCFIRPGNWGTTSPGGSLPTGYWIRYNVSGSYSTVPQIDREIYTITRNYFEFGLSAVNGNIPALAGFLARNVSASASTFDIDRVIGGLRSLSRGDEFQSIINLGGNQNHSSIAISGDGTSTAEPLEYSTGQVRRINTSGSHTITVTISDDLATHYIGEFRAFFVLRKVSSSTVDAQLNYAQYSGAQFESNELASVGSNAFTFNCVYDLGLVSIDIESNGGYLPDKIIFDIDITTYNTNNADAHSLILIPADEYQFDAVPPYRQEEAFSQFQAGDLDFAHIGSVQFDKAMYRSHFVLTDNDGNHKVQMRFTNRSNGPCILHNNEKQRMYMIALFNRASLGSDALWALEANLSIFARPFINPRYLGMRGSQ